METVRGGNVIEFTVYGIPKPAGSKRGFAIRNKAGYTGRVGMMDDSGQAGKDWRGDVKTAALLAVDEFSDGYPGADAWTPFDGPVRLTIHFYMPRPKGHYGTGRNAGRMKSSAPKFHTKKPDSTKLLRSVEDALTGIVYADDSQVVELVVDKQYTNIGRPGAAVKVEAVKNHKIEKNTSGGL